MLLTLFLLFRDEQQGMKKPAKFFVFVEGEASQKFLALELE